MIFLSSAAHLVLFILKNHQILLNVWRKWRKIFQLFCYLNGCFWNQKCSQCSFKVLAHTVLWHDISSFCFPSHNSIKLRSGLKHQRKALSLVKFIKIRGKTETASTTYTYTTALYMLLSFVVATDFFFYLTENFCFWQMPFEVVVLYYDTIFSKTKTAGEKLI